MMRREEKRKYKKKERLRTPSSSSFSSPQCYPRELCMSEGGDNAIYIYIYSMNEKGGTKDDVITAITWISIVHKRFTLLSLSPLFSLIWENSIFFTHDVWRDEFVCVTTLPAYWTFGPLSLSLSLSFYIQLVQWHTCICTKCCPIQWHPPPTHTDVCICWSSHRCLYQKVWMNIYIYMYAYVYIHHTSFFNCFRPIAICMRHSIIVHCCRHYSLMLSIMICDCKNEKKINSDKSIKENWLQISDIYVYVCMYLQKCTTILSNLVRCLYFHSFVKESVKMFFFLSLYWTCTFRCICPSTRLMIVFVLNVMMSHVIFTPITDSSWQVLYQLSYSMNLKKKQKEKKIEWLKRLHNCSRIFLFCFLSCRF